MPIVVSAPTQVENAPRYYREVTSTSNIPQIIPVHHQGWFPQCQTERWGLFKEHTKKWLLFLPVPPILCRIIPAVEELQAQEVLRLR